MVLSVTKLFQWPMFTDERVASNGWHKHLLNNFISYAYMPLYFFQNSPILRNLLFASTEITPSLCKEEMD